MIDQSLRTYLLAQSSITSKIASNGVYPQRLPQEVTKPCIVYTVHDGIENLVAGGVSALRRYQVDLTVFAEKYSENTQLCLFFFFAIGNWIFTGRQHPQKATFFHRQNTLIAE